MYTSTVIDYYSGQWSLYYMNVERPVGISITDVNWWNTTSIYDWRIILNIQNEQNAVLLATTENLNSTILVIHIVIYCYIIYFFFHKNCLTRAFQKVTNSFYKRVVLSTHSSRRFYSINNFTIAVWRRMLHNIMHAVRLNVAVWRNRPTGNGIPSQQGRYRVIQILYTCTGAREADNWLPRV